MHMHHLWVYARNSGKLGVVIPQGVRPSRGVSTYPHKPSSSKVELCLQDVLQMLGCAGRLQYDTYGEGITSIITNHSELRYHSSLMNQQLPIESQFVPELADNLDAGIVLGTVRNREEAVQWLGYTYLVSPIVDENYNGSRDVRSIAHLVAPLLEKCHLVKYARTSSRFQCTELGRIASHYYVSYNSLAIYNQHLRPSMSTLELFRVFALSNESKLLPVRQEVKLELAKLFERMPIPVKESVDEPAAKTSLHLSAQALKAYNF
ncbi:Sec63-domain-containing protein [Gyrodon lividus]|nr:Sec63-domain-containing protein [Gyrodon lividus]